jgi:hypothetical protein
LIDGDLKLTQSRAILKYLARKKSLVGKGERDEALVDMLLNVAGDFSSSITKIVYNPKYEELLVNHKKNSKLFFFLIVCLKKHNSNLPTTLSFTRIFETIRSILGR